MKALVYGGPGRRSWEEVPLPTMQDPRDAIVQIDTTTICGTDLHILSGDVPEVTPHRILGHEGVGTVLEVGTGVSGVSPGDRVLISCISACGRCRSCTKGAFGQCVGGGGWILGHTIDGLQAEFARVPFADTSLHVLPGSVTDEAALMLSDIVPTAYEVGVLNGHVSPGDVVVVVGVGPVGLAAVKTAQLFSPAHVVAIDLSERRLDVAKRMGADLVLRADHDPTTAVMELTGGRGAEVVIEAVGTSATFEMSTRLVAAGGHVANVGVHGSPAVLHLESLWIRNVTITTGLVDTSTTPTLLAMSASGQLSTAELVSHHFAMAEMMQAYDVFADAHHTGALKVVLSRS